MSRSPGGRGGRGWTVRRVVERYLLERLSEGGGPLFCRSRRVSDGTGLTAREVGMALLGILNGPDGTGLVVSKWSHAGSTVWRVERR